MIYLYVVLGALGAGGLRYLHVQRYPMKDCPRCGGARRNTSGNAHRDCTRCGATGRVRRWGAPGEGHR